MGEHPEEFTFVGFGQGLKFDFAQRQACIFAQDSSLFKSDIIFSIKKHEYFDPKKTHFVYRQMRPTDGPSEKGFQ